MERDVLLKKNIFGGFDKRQVMAYINRLQESCDDRKTRNEIDDMRSRIEILRDVLREKDKEIAILTHQIDEVSTVDLPDSNSPGYDILKRSAAQIDEAREKADEITGMLSENIKAKGDNITALFNKLTNINQSLTKLSGNLYGLSDKMENVPFEPVTEKDVEMPETPTFDFDSIVDKIHREEEKLNEISAKAQMQEKAEPVEEEISYDEPVEEPEEHETAAEAAAPEKEEKASEKRGTVTVNEDKLNILFARLVEMTEEINRVHSSISDVSEKIDRIPEEKAAIKEPAYIEEPEQEFEDDYFDDIDDDFDEAHTEDMFADADEEIAEEEPVQEDKSKVNIEISVEEDFIKNIEEVIGKSALSDSKKDVPLISKPKTEAAPAPTPAPISAPVAAPAPAPVAIAATSIIDAPSADEIPVREESSDEEEIDDIFDNFELDAPTEDSVIKSAVEKFKAEAADKLPAKKKPAEKTAAKPAPVAAPAPAPQPEKEPEAETKAKTETEVKAAETPVDSKKPESESTSEKPKVEEELYFTLNF